MDFLTPLIALILMATIVMVGMIRQRKREDEAQRQFEMIMQGFKEKADNSGRVLYNPKVNQIVVMTDSRIIHSKHGSRETDNLKTELLLKAGYVDIGDY